MYCHQYFFGGKYDLIQLHRQIVHQNDGIPMRYYLKPLPPAFSSQKMMKITWRHMEFVWIFSPADSRTAFLVTPDNNPLEFT